MGKEVEASTEEQAKQLLVDIEQNTGAKPGIIYAVFSPTTVNSSNIQAETQVNPINGDRVALKALDKDPGNASHGRDDYDLNSPFFQANTFGGASMSDQLELVLVTAEGPPVRKRVDITRAQMLRLSNEMRQEVTNVRRGNAFLRSSQQLYQALIAPLEPTMQEQGLNNLTFLMDAGLRSLPIAALHDGQQFIIENYSVGLMPSLSLTDTRYVDIKDLSVLAMGAETFPDLQPLPAVPVELDVISNRLWNGAKFLNEDFNLKNLKGVRENTPYGILHLATHAEFKAGTAADSYIQLGQEKLTLDKLDELSLNDPPVELMVLSACRTALGDEEAELGFAGLAVMAGVKSALGSLWYVSDEGTLGLMTTFYKDLLTAPIKAEALREAQLQMLQGTTRLANGQLETPAGLVELPPNLAQLSDRDFSHPYYWSAFTMIGNPW
ncbi:MAG: CHAT domain-containing protein [Synechococcaceae cyanobacterium RL_1_2]|nr:CHAT domain-containing protein [Synechococcaceae cyanobacterium RL_1_2]